MEAAQFTFKTDAFVDPPEKLKENVNGLAGHALATWISAEARKRGFEVSPVWAEDHGWDFSVAHGGAKYLCACIIQDDEAGALMFGKPGAQAGCQGARLLHVTGSVSSASSGRNPSHAPLAP